jgi:beta-galactosidase
MKLAGCTIRYAMAQPLARISDGNTRYLFLYQINGMTPEIALSKNEIGHITAEGWIKTERDGMVCLVPSGNHSPTIGLTSKTGRKSVIVLLTRSQAENSWRTTISGQEYLMISKSDLMFYPGYTEVRQLDSPEFELDIFPPPSQEMLAGKQKVKPVKNGIFSHYSGSVQSYSHPLTVSMNAEKASVENIPENLPANLSDLFISVEYLGGQAAALIDNEIIADDLFNGIPWKIGLKRFLGKSPARSISFQADKWLDNITGIDETTANKIKENGPGFSSIILHPQYSWTVRFK